MSNLQDRWWCGPFFGMYSIAGENWTVWNSFATLWTFRGHGCLNAMFFFSQLGHPNMDVVSEIRPGWHRTLLYSWDLSVKVGVAKLHDGISSKATPRQEEGIFQPWISEHPGFNYYDSQWRSSRMMFTSLFVAFLRWELDLHGFSLEVAYVASSYALLRAARTRHQERDATKIRSGVRRI